MSTDLHAPKIEPEAFEWPTWLLWLTILGGWLTTVAHFQSLPLWLSTPVLVVLCAWYMSFQHELTHGHPTRIAAINRLLGLAPLAVWYPYDTYKTNHLIHHNDAQLTTPGVDPESNYVDTPTAARLGGFGLWLKTSQRTVLGRLLIGPALVIRSLLHDTLMELARGKFTMLKVWATHLPLLALLLWALETWAGVSPLYYCFVVGYFAVGLAMLRSLYEHRPAAAPEHRTVINEAGWFWRMLYLNNNYHVVHHTYPGLAWYRVGAWYRADPARYQARNGGFVVPGYLWLIRHFAWKPVDSAVLERAAEAARQAKPEARGQNRQPA